MAGGRQQYQCFSDLKKACETAISAERLAIAMANIALVYCSTAFENTLDLLPDHDRLPFAQAVLQQRSDIIPSALYLKCILQELPLNDRQVIALAHAEKESMNLWRVEILQLLPRQAHLEFMYRTKNIKAQDEFSETLLAPLAEKIHQFETKISLMTLGGDDLDYVKYHRARDAATKLKDDLSSALKTYFENENPQSGLPALKQSVNEAVAIAEKSALKDHRGWKDFIVNLLSVIGIIKRVFTGSYLFHTETDSNKKVKALQARCMEFDAADDNNNANDDRPAAAVV